MKNDELRSNDKEKKVRDLMTWRKKFSAKDP